MSTTSADAVPLAETLLDLVRSLSGQKPGVQLSPQRAWDTKIQVQNVCDRLLASIMGPLEYTVLLAESCQESQALHFVTSLGIADFIADGESTLMELSKKAGVQPQFLGVTMSCLLGRGYFEEVGKSGSRVYRNNELSQVLRETHPSSLKNAIGFIGDEGFRATSYLLDAAKIPPSASNGHVAHKKLPAVNLAFGFTSSVFEWMASPEHAWRGKRMGQAMQQLHRMANGNVPEDYPWYKLHSPIIDIGGGIGSLELSLINRQDCEHLEFVLFDLPKTIENAKKVWSTQSPSILKRVSFVGGNFMAPTLAQSKIPTGKPTYIIRHVLHDWTDTDVVNILTAVRQAMPIEGRLLLVEMLLRPESSRFVRTTSMQLLALNSGVTRTQEEMEGLAIKAGFRVVGITYMRAVDSVIELAMH